MAFVAIIVFYASIRFHEHEVPLTFAALVSLLAAYGVHRWSKKINEKK
ncbi:hypothetical protein [Persicobacter sp. CCB-QB2]|nr:hypothetical protein [Persicobacter sp. CCB-QB2]